MATRTNEAKSISLLVLGKTGAGKSSLINSILGRDVTHEGGDYEIGTKEIECFREDVNGITVSIWDTPGLYDDSGKTKSYLEKIESLTFDLAFFCSDMTDTRVTEQDRRIVSDFTRVLGADFWRRALFVFTFANEVKPRVDRSNPAKIWDAFTEKQHRLQEKYTAVLKDQGKIPSDIIERITFVAVGYHPWSPEKEMYMLPCGPKRSDKQNWFSSFWMACIAKVMQVPTRTPREAECKCTYDEIGDCRYVKQDWFECYTCWGKDSNFGCCFPCSIKCHEGHALVKHRNESFYCDCGHNGHQNAVCTFHSSGRKYLKQPFYRCYTCFTDPATNGLGVCYPCMIRCHRDHQVTYAGVLSAFCDCGLEACRIYCTIRSV